MAIEKALFTSKDDFATPSRGNAPFQVVPYLYFNGVDMPTDVAENPYSGGSDIHWIGTGRQTVDGAVGKGQLMNGSALNWMSYGIQPHSQHMYALLIKPTADDVLTPTTGTNFRILATTRGDGWADRGLHLALINGMIEIRTYAGPAVGSNIWDTVQTNGADMPLFTLNADTWYHIVVRYDYTDASKLELWVNGQMIGSTSTQLYDLNYKMSNSITLGEKPSSAGTIAGTNFLGVMDEFYYCVGSNIWSRQQIQDYYNFVANADYYDLEVTGEDASMILGKSAFTGYTKDIQTWTSPSIDLGPDGFGDFGRVQLNYEAPPGTGIMVQTRSSKDGQTWNDWITISNTGTINSPDEQYLQIKVDFYTTDSAVTPKIMEVQVLDYPKKKRLSLTSEPLVIYRDLETGLERMGELVNASDIYITEEINGEETLEFKMATNDPKRIELGTEPVELCARIGDKQFIIRNPIDKRDDSGKKYTEFFCEAQWYELRDFKVISFESIEDTAFNTMQKILDASIVPTGWTVYTSNITIKRTIRGDWKSVLELLQEVRDTFGGELQFDTIEKTISLVDRIGEDNGVRFYYNKNLKSIERSVDTFSLVTRLYLYGKNDLTIKSVNNNVEYLENLTWVNALNLRNKIRIDRWSDSRYTIPQNLYDDGMKMLDELSKPNIAYVMKLSDLSMLSGHEHETIGLGDTVHAIDTELLNMVVDSRIMKRKYNVRQPWKTEVELNQPKKELADANQRNIDDSLELLAETDPLDTTDVQQMTVFNQLLNSRAEDGTTYWEVTGTGIANEIGGFSGNSSWKFTGGYGVTNILKQSIFGVSHRSAYTVSAYVATDGTITRGATQDAFVGIRVRIHYKEPDDKGNMYEDHLLAIPDITQEGGA